MASPLQVVDIEHARNIHMQNASDYLEGFSRLQLMLFVRELNRCEADRTVDLTCSPALTEMLAIPTLLAEVKRRLELAELEGDGELPRYA